MSDIGCNLHGFDIRYQKKSEAGQPNKADFKFSEDVAAEIHAFASVLTKKLVSVSSVGQRHFDLI